MDEPILTLIEQILAIGHFGFEIFPLIVGRPVGALQFLQRGDELVFFFVNDGFTIFIEKFT